MFKIHGIRTDDTLNAIPEIADEMTIAASPSRVLELRSDFRTQHSTPSMSSDGSSGDIDSAEEIDFNLLDFDLEQEAIEINEEGEQIVSSFSVCVSDMDTG